MKNLLFFALFACCTINNSFAGIPSQQSLQASDDLTFPCKKITLYAGTLVVLECNEKIETNNVSVGQTILFKVKMDVKAENEVAISTGALAMGVVKRIEESTYNGPAEIRVELKYVQAVDGQQVPLNGNELSAFGEKIGRGNSSKINFGTNITANVTNNIDIKAQ